MDETSNIKQLIIEGIQERKGKRISVVDMTAIESAPTEMFIIAQGSSSMQVASIADSVREYVQEKSGVKPFNYDGYANSEWIAIDYGEIMVHIFLPPVRERYNLEDLWSDAQIREIPDLD
ncbi:MAG: ribosome silencing factor [Clostridium sp.]|nr:ribosome silencing factor [Clostridium sp.]